MLSAKINLTHRMKWNIFKSLLRIELIRRTNNLFFLQILGTFVAYVIISVQFVDGDSDCGCGDMNSDFEQNATTMQFI